MKLRPIAAKQSSMAVHLVGPVAGWTSRHLPQGCDEILSRVARRARNPTWHLLVFCSRSITRLRLKYSLVYLHHKVKWSDDWDIEAELLSKINPKIRWLNFTVWA
jgi:hypothetical protein